MKRFLFVILLLSLVSCDNGDIEVPSFDFDSEIASCDENTVLYLTSLDNTEAFIMQLPSTVITTEVGTTTIKITADNCNYRLFDDVISTNYFCAVVPPARPSVVKNWEAVAGPHNIIEIETTTVSNSEGNITGYKHSITLYNLILENNNQTITHNTYKFGSFTTSL